MCPGLLYTQKPFTALATSVAAGAGSVNTRLKTYRIKRNNALEFAGLAVTESPGKLMHCRYERKIWQRHRDMNPDISVYVET